MQATRAGVTGAQELEGEDREETRGEDAKEPVVPDNRSFMESLKRSWNELVAA